MQQKENHSITDLVCLPSTKPWFNLHHSIAKFLSIFAPHQCFPSIMHLCVKSKYPIIQYICSAFVISGRKQNCRKCQISRRTINVLMAQKNSTIHSYSWIAKRNSLCANCVTYNVCVLVVVVVVVVVLNCVWKRKPYGLWNWMGRKLRYTHLFSAQTHQIFQFYERNYINSNSRNLWLRKKCIAKWTHSNNNFNALTTNSFWSCVCKSAQNNNQHCCGSVAASAAWHVVRYISI